MLLTEHCFKPYQLDYNQSVESEVKQRAELDEDREEEEDGSKPSTLLWGTGSSTFEV